MEKTKSDIRRKLKWTFERLKNPKLGKATRKRCLVYATAMVAMFSGGERASAEANPDHTQQKTEDLRRLASNAVTVEKDLSNFSIQETFEHYNMSDLSLKDIRAFTHEAKFNFTPEELRAMTPGPLAQTILEHARKEAKGKKCKRKCFARVKDVLFSAAVRQQLRATDGSFLPATRWGTVSAYQGAKDMATLPQFMCCKIEHENMADVPDGSVLVFGPTKKHPDGHIAYKDGDILLSDGQEILANIPKTKYSSVVAFIPVDNTISPSAIKESPYLEAYCNHLKMKERPKVSMPTFDVKKIERPEHNTVLATMANNSRSRD